MKVSRERMAEHRRNILNAASRLFRTRGFEAVTVAEVMQAAGLTHGGFYGHFRSKDDLIAQTVAHVLEPGAKQEVELADYAADYLSAQHRDDVAGGCPVAALCSETSRQTPEARAAMTANLRRQIDRLSRGVSGPDAAANRKAAIGAWAAMVGAMILARVSDDPALSYEVLIRTRDWIASKGAAGPGPNHRSTRQSKVAAGNQASAGEG
jgi:TetR/AcrR family transcriptional repressor of nem operon